MMMGMAREPRCFFLLTLAGMGAVGPAAARWEGKCSCDMSAFGGGCGPPTLT